MIVKSEKIQSAYPIQSGLCPPYIALATSNQSTPIAVIEKAALGRDGRGGG